MNSHYGAVMITITCLYLVESRNVPCTLDCPEGQRCAVRRSTCPYPPCKKYQVCESDDEMPSEVISSRPSSFEAIHPGVCTISTDQIGSCAIECQNDGDCMTNQKCCFNGCGKTCSASHAVEITKPGSCPRRLRNQELCGMDCTSDNDCPGVEKCCLTSCGSTCSRPCYYWLWSVQNRATGGRSAFWASSPQCRHL